MATCEAETTVEELDLSIGLKYTIHSADIVAKIEGYPEEKRTHEYPGCPAQANVHDLTVTKCYVCNRATGQEYTSVNKAHLRRVRTFLLNAGWHEKQDDWALEHLGDHEQDQYEAAQEAKAERQRDDS